MRPFFLRALAGCIAAFAITACPKSKGQSHPDVFTPPSFDGGTQSKELGEDCGSGGPGDCKSGLCFHYLPNAASGFACSRKCQADAECPAGWSCQNTYPAPGNDFCVPPRSWTPQVAQARN
jgi:hypothetical protein